jgi:TonB-linked SusC/RagA family outer membrane protein
MIQNKKFSIHLLRLSLRIIARPSFIKGLSVLIISMFILFPVFVFAEGGHMPFENSFQNDQWIEGNISDEEGTPLLGVTVYEQNSTNGTISDKEGHYRIMVSDNAQILVFQSVGKQTQKVEIGGRTRIDIVMTEEVYGIDEVVVTALGIKKLQKSIGYSTQKVAGEVLTKAQEPNIISNLTGRVAGLTVYNSTDFFATSSLRLRGERPLIVIDGIPNENSDLWEVNGDDIESIDILKGAAASALYGSIGRNGAIMITTKRGNLKDRLEVEINSSTIFQPDFLRVPEIQTTYGSGRLGKYRYVDGTGSGIEGSGFSWGPKLDVPDPNTRSGFVEIVQYNSPVNPANGNLVPLPWISRGENNLDNFLRTGIISNNSVSITTGNKERNMRVSFANKSQRGVAPNTQLGSSTFGLSGAYTYNKLRMDASVFYNKQYSDNIPEVSWSSESYIYNLTLWMGANIDVRDLQNYWAEGQEGYQQRHYMTTWYNNPYFLVNEYSRSYNKDMSYGQLSFTYDIAPVLEVKLRSGFNYYGLNRETREPISFVRNFARTQGDFSVQNDNDFAITTDLIVSYTKVFGDLLRLNARAGASNNYNNHRYSGVSTDGLIIPGFYNINNSLNIIDGSNNMRESKRNSVYANFDLEFLNSIYLNISGRNDWVSTLPLNNNSFFYPSVGLSYVLTDMFDMAEPLTFLKLRASWAQVSNGDLGSTYAHLTAYSSGVNWMNNTSLYYPGTLVSPDLKPETSSSFETGFDVRILQNRLGLDVTYFYTLDFNNIIGVPISGTSGFSSRLMNANEYEKKGVEVVLRATPVKKKEFQWDVVANLGQVKTYIKKIEIGDRIGYRQEGDRMDELWVDVWMRNQDGELIIGDNGINVKDPFPRMIGFNSPDWSWGIQNTFRYGLVSLFIGIDGRIGGLMESKTIRNMWWAGVHPESVNEYREASNAGEATYVAEGVVITGGSVEYDAEGIIISDTRQYAPNTKAVNYENYITTFHSRSYGNHYYDETFLKLRELNISFSFPQKWLARTSIRQASASVVGRNLALLSKVKYIDPDSGGDLSMQTPSMKSIGVNFSITF